MKAAETALRNEIVATALAMNAAGINRGSRAMSAEEMAVVLAKFASYGRE